MLYYLMHWGIIFCQRYLFRRTQAAAVKSMAQQQKPKVVFVLGAPGSGKGTQCSKISEKFDFLHLSAGDLLRKEKSNPESSVGQLISNYIKEGKIVPVEITCKLLEDAVFESSKTKVLIDGFPRNQNNLDGWIRQMSDKVDVCFVLFLDCPEEVCVGRILERSKTSGRSDDNIESLKKRFQTYINETLPIVNTYEKLDKVRNVDATKGPEEVFDSLRAYFAAL